MKKNPFAFFISQLTSHLPEPLQPFQAEIKETAKRVVNEKLCDFELVARAEFEAQIQQLVEAQERIAALEARIANLESAK